MNRIKVPGTEDVVRSNQQSVARRNPSTPMQEQKELSTSNSRHTYNTMVEAEVSERDFQEEAQVYRSIVRELGYIRNRVDKVLSDFQDHMDENYETEEEMKYTGEYLDLVVEKYENIQNEREKILQSLKLFFQNQIHLQDDELVSSTTKVDLPLDVTETEKSNFMVAWKTALRDIDRMKEINKQLLKMGKEFQSFTSSEEVIYNLDANLDPKSQLDYMKSMFTAEAKQNMRMTREISQMTKEISTLKEQNEILLCNKVNEQERASELIDNIRQAEKQIKELQLEVNKTSNEAISANSFLKRMEAAYTHQKTETFNLEAQNRQLVATKNALAKQQESDLLQPSKSGFPENGRQLEWNRKQKSLKRQSAAVQESKKIKRGTNSHNGRTKKQQLLKLSRNSGEARTKISTDHAMQLSNNVTKIRQRKEEALKRKKEVKFGKVRFANDDFELDEGLFAAEESEVAHTDPKICNFNRKLHNKLSHNKKVQNGLSLHNKDLQSTQTYHGNEVKNGPSSQNEELHSELSSHNGDSQNDQSYSGQVKEHKELFGQPEVHSKQSPCNTGRLLHRRRLSRGPLMVVGKNKANQSTISNNSDEIQELSSSRLSLKNKISSSRLRATNRCKNNQCMPEWAFLTPKSVVEIPPPPQTPEHRTYKLKRKDLLMVWKNSVIVQQGNSVGQFLSTQTKPSSPTDFNFSYNHAHQYYKNKSSSALPLITITPIVMTT